MTGLAERTDVRPNAIEGLIDVGDWHRKQPQLLARALEEARRVAPHLDALAHYMLPRAPRRPHASQDLRSISLSASTAPLMLDRAVTCPWMTWDSERVRNVLAVDIDHSDGPDRAEELAAIYGLPRPTLVIDPWSGRSHAIWPLAMPVCISDQARIGPRILADLACRLLAKALRGTPLPPRAPTKSPWGWADDLIGLPRRHGSKPASQAFWDAWVAADTDLMWHTEPGDLRPVELRQIIAALVEDYGEEVVSPRIAARFRKRRSDPSALGRNCCLFDLTRWWAYDNVEHDGGAILAEAQRVNATFAIPLPASEVAATARSIARFMAMRYQPRIGAGGRSRGRDRAAGADLLSVPARQALSGRRTAADRAADTDRKIAAAMASLHAAGRRPTQAALADEAGVSLRTVKGRWKALMVQDGALSGNVLLGSPHPRRLKAPVGRVMQPATRRQRNQSIRAPGAINQCARPDPKNAPGRPSHPNCGLPLFAGCFQ